MVTQQQNVPALRFPKFSGAWTEKQLGAIGAIKTGPFGSLLHEKDYVDKGTPIITVEHLGELGIKHRNLPLVSEKDKERLKGYILKVDDIVFSRVGSVDRNSIIKPEEDGWLFSGRLLRIRTESRHAHAKFLSFSFQQVHTKYKIRSVAVGQTMPSLNTNIIRFFCVFSPSSILEQQKIASFLSSVDTKIEQLGKKKALLEQYKKGMMQKLFSQEIRFKDEQGNEYPGWDKRKLSDFSEINRGKTIVRNDIVNEGYPVIAGGQRSPYCHSSFTHENVITVSASGAFAGYVSYHPHKIWASDCSVVRAKSSSCTLFVYYLLNHLQTRIYVLQSGGAQPHVYPKDLYTLTVTIPVSSKEQQKIANFLSAIDKKIELVAQQLEQARTFKKGLLQQMFI